MANPAQEKTADILFYSNLGIKAENIKRALESKTCNANYIEQAQEIISNCRTSYNNANSKYAQLMRGTWEEYAKKAEGIMAKIKKMDYIPEEVLTEEIEFFRRISTNCVGYLNSLN
jgi:hypothetical protein